MGRRPTVGLLAIIVLAAIAAGPTPAASVPAVAQAEQPPFACTPWIIWSQALACAGQTTWVAGTVVEVSYARWEPRWPTTLSLGRASPDRERFDAIIWGTERWKWSPSPEEQYLHRNVCVHGLIALYRGVPEIDVAEPEQLTICE
jgi:hypothetical protein